MTGTCEARYQELAEVARDLGPAITDRGVLQHFYVAPGLPMKPLRLDEILDAWRAYAEDVRAARAPELLHLYLHLPFCARKCGYCVYYSVEDDSSDRLDAYLERLRGELDLYSEVFGGVGFSTCYLGGGTPSLLDEARLESLLSRLDRSLARTRGGEWAFECNPASITAAKAALFVAHGFNRVSFGVQSLNPAVLAGVNRGYQTLDQVERVMEIMRGLELCTNIDLIYGLPGEAPGSMDRSLETIFALAPTQVTVYLISPFTPMDTASSAREPLSVIVPRVRPIADAYGYGMKVGHTHLAFSLDAGARPDDLLLRERAAPGRRGRSYDDTTVEPCALLGIGPTSRSAIYGRMRYEQMRYPVDQPLDREGPYAIGRSTPMEEERRRFAVYRLEGRTGLRGDEFAATFGTKLGEALGPELEAMRSLGLIERRADAFFLVSDDPLERFVSELFLVEPEKIAFGAPGTREDVAGGAPAKEVEVPSAAADPVVRVSMDGTVVPVALVRHVEGRPAYHHRKGFAFYVPAPLPDGTCRFTPEEERVLALLTEAFDGVVDGLPEASLEDLEAALLAHAGGDVGIIVSPGGRA